ncbi:hypothetical protein [Oscillatoria nigro-viridis]|nr:hypothetical protein [Oscillatoria nigro-viridis]
MPTPPIHDLLGIWWDWGSHGGQPLQENETALLLSLSRFRQRCGIYYLPDGCHDITVP